jgi:DNA-binding response OmpR family regulator
MSRQILIIEDNHDIAKLLSLHLSDLDCRVEVAGDGVAGLRAAAAHAYDLIILDLMLPGVDGLEVCRRLREKVNYKSSEVDRVVGLEVGADDYLTKPFSVRELLARVKAIFRRIEAFATEGNGGAKRLRAGDIAIDVDKRAVTVGGAPVDLTAKEFDLLLKFAERPGRVYTRSQLLDLVWGYGHVGYEHTVNSHINRLRAKIEHDPAKPNYILTVWGVGYKFNDRLAG